ncbi:histidine kinase [Fragilaria crotonensis]|nr:histidine kinase [Fragilaria crotonensis]
MLEHERLDLNAKHWWLFGRERELAILDGALERASSGSRELVFVAGPSGMGKASIAEYLNHGQKCLFARGKFDAIPNAPFAAIISVCVELITITCRDKPLKEKVSNSMSHEMTEADLSSLLAFLPTFRDLLDNQNRSCRVAALSQAHNSISHKKDLLTQIKFAVRAFLRIVTRHSSCPLILCLQDLQWADDTSMDLLEFIAEDRDQTRFIIAVTYSAEDTDIGRRAQQWVKRVSTSKTQKATVSNIHVDPLVLEQLNRLLSVVMKMREEETMPLAVHLMPLTTGNLFAALQIMEQWENQGVLTYNTSMSHWEWDLEKSKGISVSEGLADMLSNRIRRLPSDVQRVLQLSACLGYRFEPSFLEAIKEALPGDLLDVKSILQFCFDESLLEPQGDGRVMFLHKTIHQGALLYLPQGDELEKLHLRIGILLWHHLKHKQISNDRTLFLCVDYMIMGSNHVEDDIMLLELAELCNVVGNKALELSAFVIAANYFKKGIELLNKICCSKWDDFHELTESMFVSFAELQYYNGKFGECLKAIHELLANKPSESACANLTRLQILKDKGNLRKFVVSSLVFLNELGVTFPSRFTMERARLLRYAVMKKLNGMHDATIMNLPRVTDLTTITVMKVLNLMTVAVIELGLVHLSAMTLHKAVLLSLTQGLSDSSPGAFVLLGAYLISEKGMLPEGYRMGQLAINMSQELDMSTADGFVAHWVHGMTGLWQRTTLAERLPPLLQGHVTALKNGDPCAAFMSINQYITISFFSSTNLCYLMEDMEKYSILMLEYGQKSIFLQILPLWQCILNLSGRSQDPST